MIYVVDEGRTVEYGTHEELFDRCGLVESLCEDGIVLSDGRVMTHESVLVGA